MCCKSKPKPVGTADPSGKTLPAGSTSKLPSGAPTSSSKLPKSTILFNANDYEQKTLTNQTAFVYTTKFKELEQDRGDRQQDYAQEINEAQRSKLLEPKQLLTYDLDKPGGVSQISVVNTFHYETSLGHVFWGYPSSTIKNEKTNNNSTGLPNQEARNSSSSSSSSDRNNNK